MGISIDSAPSHKAFAEKIGVSFPLLSDMHRRVSRMYGVLLEEQGVSARATFIVDRQGIIRYQLVNDLAIPRDEKEMLRIIKALEQQQS